MSLRGGVTRLARWALLLCFGLPAPVAAATGGLPAAPILRIETGGHVAIINRIVSTPAGDAVVTVSDDKTARVWSLEDHRLLQVLRPPIDVGAAEGALYAVSVTGSGKFFAFAGHTGFADRGHAVVYLYRRFGKPWVGAVLLPGTGAVNDLAFSPGSRSRDLAIASQDDGGLRVVSLKSLKPRIVDDSYGGGINRLEFSPAGLLATTSDDGFVRLYDGDFAPMGRYRAPNGARPWSLAFSPDGTRLAVGYLERASVDVLEVPAMTLTRQHAGRSGRQGGFSAVAWGADGSAVLGAGYYGAGSRKLLAKWVAGKDDPPAETDLAGDTVTDLQALESGAVAFATAEPSWGVVTAEGQVRFVQPPAKADFRDANEAFRVAPDGSLIDFALKQGGLETVRFDLATGRISRDPGPEPGLDSPVTTWNGGEITHWKNTTRPRLAGREVKLGADEIARSAAYDAVSGTALIGTDFALRAYGQDGVLRWQRALPAAAWAVNAASETGLAVAGLGDGTLRWFRIDSGEPVMSAYVDPTRLRWISWTPEGFFDDQGRGAASLIGYHVNRLDDGGPRGTDFVSVEQVYELFARTDLVAKKMRGSAEDEIHAELARIGEIEKVIERGLPPRIDLEGYCTGGGESECAEIAALSAAPAGRAGPGDGRQRRITVDSPKVTLKLALADLGGGVGEVSVRRQGARIASFTPTGDGKAEIDVALEPGTNLISVSAMNTAGEIETPLSERPILAVDYVDQTRRKPVLHLLAIGVNEYSSETISDLRYAAKDAKGIAKTMAVNDQELYSEVRALVVVDDQATQANIIESLTELQRRVKPWDLALVFLAGHGTTVNGQYYFLPTDLPDLPDDGSRRNGIIVENAISQQRLTSYLGHLQATRTLIVLDTCYAGAFAVSDSTLSQSRDQTVGKQISHASGRFVLAASSSLELAIDGYRGHGLFTRVVLDGLNGKADTAKRGDGDGKINIYELGEFVKERVPRIATKIGGGHEQTPRWYFSGDEMFDIRSARGKQ